MFSIFVRFHASASARLVGDELRVRFHDGVEDAQPVGAQRRAGFGRFDDRVGQHRRLDLGGAPRELDVDAQPFLREVVLRHAHQLGGDALAVEIVGALERRVLGRGQHPAHLAEALLRVDQVGDR